MSGLRPPRLEEAPLAAQLMDEHWPEPVDSGGLVNDWTAPTIELERDARIGDGVYVLVEGLDEGRAWIEIHGRPDRHAVDWAEARACELGANRALTGGWSTNAALFAELERRGYRRVRSSARMEISLEQPVPTPSWPDGIEVRTMREGEERAVYGVHQETFEDVWEPMRRSYEDWAHWHLEPPRFAPDFWFLARAGDEICGVAMCHPHPTVPELGWVGVLGVRRRFRGRGVGRALLLQAFGAFRARGLTRAGLGVDAESPTGAFTLYEAVGMRPAHRFLVYQKTLP